jgi:hypothetical protein
VTDDLRAILVYTWAGAMTVGLAALRIAGHKSPAFQAVAHIFVGGLFGAWAHGGKPARPYLWLAVLLSLVELACFLMGVGGHS